MDLFNYSLMHLTLTIQKKNLKFINIIFKVLVTKKTIASLKIEKKNYFSYLLHMSLKIF